jgi:antitoxin (DNA-binding transcriptional repressor) of toxin-antitoxin stability system
MIRTSIDAAKAQLEEIIEAALRGEEVFVTTTDDGGEREVRIFAVQTKPEAERRRRAGTAKGMFWVADDFDEPLEDFDEYMR